MAAEDVSGGQTPGQAPKGPRRSRPKQRVHGEALAGPEVVAGRAERVGAGEDALLGPPERGFPPPAPVDHAQDLERRAGDAAEGEAVELHAEPLGEARAVALVAIEQLDDACGLAERADPLLDALPVDRVDEPHASVRAQGVRGLLQEGGLGRDPAESKRGLVAEADVHASGSTPRLIALASIPSEHV